jgi:hypothetical protein
MDGLRPLLSFESGRPANAGREVRGFWRHRGAGSVARIGAAVARAPAATSLTSEQAARDVPGPRGSARGSATIRRLDRYRARRWTNPSEIHIPPGRG